jgi:caa(3)-type oxidase subunit IV
MAEHAKAHEHAHPNYVKIWGILVVLLGISIAGPMIGIKVVTIITAFGIAIVKAYLVAKNFMHINIEPKFVTYIVSTCLLLMALFFFFVAPDVMKHEGQNWENVAAQAAVEGKLGGGAAGGAAAFDAAGTFKTVCGSCHGENGDGKGAAAAGLNPKPADFTDAKFWGSRTRDTVVKAIAGGGPAVGKSPLMAPYGEAYTEEQIDALADYVMEFR